MMSSSISAMASAITCWYPSSRVPQDQRLDMSPHWSAQGRLGRVSSNWIFHFASSNGPTRNLYKAQCQPSHVFFPPTCESVDFKSAVPWGIPRPNEFRLMVMATKSIPMIDKSRLGALQIPANLTYKYPNFWLRGFTGCLWEFMGCLWVDYGLPKTWFLELSGFLRCLNG